MIILLLCNYYKIDSYRNVLHFSFEQGNTIMKTTQSSTTSSISSSPNLDYDMFIKDRISFNMDLQYKIKHSTVFEADHWLTHIHSKITSEQQQQPHQHQQKYVGSSYLNKSCADTINIYIKDAIDNRSNLTRAIMLFESYFSSGLGRL